MKSLEAIDREFVVGNSNPKQQRRDSTDNAVQLMAAHGSNHSKVKKRNLLTETDESG